MSGTTLFLATMPSLRRKSLAGSIKSSGGIMSMIALMRITCLAMLLLVWAGHSAMAQVAIRGSKREDPVARRKAMAYSNGERHGTSKSSHWSYGWSRYYFWRGQHYNKKNTSTQIVPNPRTGVIYKRASLVGATTPTVATVPAPFPPPLAAPVAAPTVAPVAGPTVAPPADAPFAPFAPIAQ